MTGSGDRPLRVLFAIQEGGGNGAAYSSLHLALGLAARGVHVRFVCKPDSEVEALAREGGLEVHPFPFRPKARRANAAALEALLARYPVDLASSQSSRDRNALTWLALTRRLHVPYVVTRRQMPHSSPIDVWITGRLAARTIAVSTAVAAALVRRGAPRRKVRVIPNGLITARVDRAVEPAEVAAWRERIGWTPGLPTLGIVSRPKDQHVVLEALRRVRTPVRLVLAGIPAGHRLQRLAAEADARGPHRVVAFPFDTNVRPLYELLDWVLLPSRMEGLSQALLEAMALGKPVVASRAAGNPDLIRDGEDGLLVPPLDRAAWAAAIERAVTDRALGERLGRAARHTARETFSLERTVELTLACYREVVEGHRAAHRR